MKNIRSSRQTESFTDMLGPVWKAVAVAALLTIALILLFALAMKLGALDDSSVPIVNQAIKVLGILLAAFFATRKDGRKIHRAVVSGVAYIIFSIIIFSLLEGSFAFSLSMLWDVLMGALIGLLAGLLFTRAQKA